SRRRGTLVRLGMRTARQAVLLQRRLHGGDVLLHLVEVNAERGRVELPLRNAWLDDGPFCHGAHFGRGVAAYGFRDPHERGRGPGDGEERAPRGPGGASSHGVLQGGAAL